MNGRRAKIESLQRIITEKNNAYLWYHAVRYEELINFVEDNFSAGKRILDIGNSPFSEILSTLFHCQVDELGFFQDSIKPFGKQYQFNLNDCHDKSLWRTDLGLYDIIIFAEVIEHLHTSPGQILAYLSSLLEKEGKLILQTPNAAVLHKRLQLLFGKNPYMKIRENRFNPGHYREYTKSELITYAKNCGFKIDNVYYGNYFNYQYTFTQSRKGKVNKYLKIVNLVYSVLPSSLKPGITMIISKA